MTEHPVLTTCPGCEQRVETTTRAEGTVVVVPHRVDEQVCNGSSTIIDTTTVEYRVSVVEAALGELDEVVIGLVADDMTRPPADDGVPRTSALGTGTTSPEVVSAWEQGYRAAERELAEAAAERGRQLDKRTAERDERERQLVEVQGFLSERAAERDRAEEALDGTRGALSACEHTLDNVRGSLADRTAQVERLVAEVAEQRVTQRALETDLARVTEQRDKAEHELDAARNLLTSYARDRDAADRERAALRTSLAAADEVLAQRTAQRDGLDDELTAAQAAARYAHEQRDRQRSDVANLRAKLHDEGVQTTRELTGGWLVRVDPRCTIDADHGHALHLPPADVIVDVDYYRHPDVDGETMCEACGARMRHHGWIDSDLIGGHGLRVCPQQRDVVRAAQLIADTWAGDPQPRVAGPFDGATNGASS